MINSANRQDAGRRQGASFQSCGDATPIELICVNDGSTDGTLEVLKSFGERIVLIDCARNGGISEARNQGIKRASGTYLAFIDADDLWEPGKLTLQMERLEENPNIDILFAHMQCFLSPELPDEVKTIRECPPDPMPGYIPGTALMKTKSFKQVGLFDPKWRVGEFIDWFTSAKEAGLSFMMEDKVLLRRRIHETNTGVTQRDWRVDYVKVVREALARKRGNS